MSVSLKTPSGSNVTELDNTIIITKWLWDYESFLEYQTYYQQVVRESEKLKIFLICNHPHCFTLGRGNERGNSDLIDFPDESLSNLDLPSYKIHRGGGITFHHPGQWIFYPIMKISPNYTLEDHMCWQLKLISNTLRENFNLDYVVATKKTMGVWYQKKKVASIGVGVKRFVTEHGIATNILFDDRMKQALSQINPCGLNSSVYTSLSEIISKQVSIDSFDSVIRGRLK